MIGGNSRGSDMLIEHSLIMAVWTQVVPKTKEAAIHRKPRRTMKASECVSKCWALESTILSPTFKASDFQVFGLSLIYMLAASIRLRVCIKRKLFIEPAH